MTKIIVALGSNHNQEKNISKARSLLAEAFGDDISFTESMLTEPVGMVSDRFLNCLCFAETALTQDDVTSLLKQMETECGNTEELRKQNVIEMDIDLLKFGETRLKQDDWQHDYIKTLYASYEKKRKTNNIKQNHLTHKS